MTTINVKGHKADFKSLTSRKAILTSSAAAIIMALGAAPAAQAQTNIVITTGSTPAENPGGGMVTAAEGVVQTVTAGDNIELEDNSNDGSVITNSGTLINNDEDDEDVVIFIDNSEDDVVITNTATGVLQGVDGVIFQEGDALTLTNAGLIEGIGAANEGVIYIDRDSDSNLNSITNTGTITGIGGPTIGADSLLGSVGGADDEVATAADQVTFDGTSTLEIINSGTISNTGDGNAIFFNGDSGSTSEGSTSSSDRGCLENVAGASAQQVNCQFNITVTNSGTISAADMSSAAIRSDDDAVINGMITNAAGGTISGATAISINGAHSEHDLTIENAGTISSAIGDAIVITGDGVTVNNLAGGLIDGAAGTGLVVAGTDIEVETSERTDANNANVGGASAVEVPVTVAAINNTFFNAGTISGGTAAADFSGAGEAITFTNAAGTLTGDFLGTTNFTDNFVVTDGETTLTDNILQGVNVNVTETGVLAFAGGNMINGDLVSDGALNFALGNDPVAVSGDVTLNAGSTVNVDDVSQVTGLDQTFTLIDVGGTLVNNSTLVPTVADTSFLLDFQAITDASGNLAVISVAAGDTTPAPTPVTPTPTPDPVEPTPTPTPDPVEPTPEPVTPPPAPELSISENIAPNLLALRTAVIAAAVTDNFNISELAPLNEAEFATLLPDTNDSSAQQILEVVGDIGKIVDRRIARVSGSYLACGTTTDPRFKQNQSGISNVSGEGCASVEDGVWAEGGYRRARQSSSTSNGTFDAGYDADIISFAVGLDQALSNDTLIGVSASYSNLDVDQRSSTSESDIDVYQVTLYGSQNYGNINVSGQASYARGDVSSERQSATGEITGDFDVDGFNIQGLATYDFELDDNAYVSPLVGLQYGDFSTDSFTEEGGLGLGLGSGSTDAFEGRAGIITGKKYAFTDTELDFYVSAAYVYEFSGGRDDLDLTIANQTTSLTTSDGDGDRAEGTIGINFSGAQNLRFGVAVDGEASSNYTSIGGNLQVKYAF